MDHSTLPLFSLQPEAREIPLSKGKVTIVDAADYEWLSQWKWFAHKSRSCWYACRNNSELSGSRIIRMHRTLIEVPDGLYVDHINRNSLDNRRSNLRLATNRENQWNTEKCDASGMNFSISKTFDMYRVRIEISRLLTRDDAKKLKDEIAQLIRSHLSGWR